jgi:hypothetical protein
MDTSYEYVAPTYCIKQFNESTFSVTKFKRSGLPSMVSHEKEDKDENEAKLENSFSRARSMIKQYGLCNDWDYFVTLTLDPKKYNRYELKKFKTDLIRFACDIRKKYKKLDNRRLSYVFVPENHKDGAWHMHGLLYGLPQSAVSDFVRGVHPDYLVDNGFFNWPDYADKFGFVSLGIIRDKIGTVLYTTKYIDKNIKALSDMKGDHLYMASRPLKTAEKAADVYGNYPELDGMLTNDYKFCKTGMVFDGDWTFPMRYDDNSSLIPLEDIDKPVKPLVPEFRPETIDPSVQMNVFEMCNERIWV